MATRPIDEKLVAMKMDNSDFVKKASETTKLMGGLTKFLNKIPGINLGKTTSEFQNINKSIDRIDTNRLSDGINTISNRFSTMGIIGTTALVNIANRAVDAGLAMVKNLTVTPVLDGFREYELKMGSIQTILANTQKDGTGLDDVTKSLEELNHYADKTIYNFGQMTKNIGLFTNAGLKLEESTSMIKGFSNAAAASGAGAEEMARAAYQMSQGLASGYIMTIDWLSLTNAGMGNDNMKRDLIALGQAMGTLNKSTEATLTNWKESLSDDKWLTKDVFSIYLQAMAGDLDKARLKTIGLTDAQADLLLQNAKTGEEAATKVRTFTQMMSTLVESIGSGWSESWEIIVGDFEHATKLWSGFSELVSEPFNKLTESRNKFLKTLKDQGVFEEMFVALGSAIYVVGKAVGAVTDGFNKAFSSDKVGIVTSFVQGFKNLVSAMTPSQESLVKIATIFQALGSNVKVVMKLIGDIGRLLLKLVPDNLGANILSIFERLASMNIAFNEMILNGDGIKGVFQEVGNVFSWVGDRIGNVIDGFTRLTKSITDSWSVLSNGKSATNEVVFENSKMMVSFVAVNEAIKSIIKSIKSMDLSLKPISDSFVSFFTTIRNGFNWMKEKLSGIGNAIKESMPNGTTLFAGGFVAALVAITTIVLKKVNDVTKIFSEWGNIIKGFADTLDSVSNVLDAFALNIKANALLTASIAVGALAVSILLLSRVNGVQIGNSLTAIVGSLTAVIGAMAVMNRYDVTGGLKVTTSIVGMAVALSIMSIALKKFGSLKPEELTKGLIGVVVMMGALAGAFAVMGKFGGNGASATALQMVAMGASLLLVAKAVKEIGSLNPAELTTGITGLAIVMAALASSFALMGKFSAKGAASSLQLIAMAGSIVVLVGAIKMISLIDTKDLLIGLGTITAILAVIAGFATLTSNTGLLGSAVGLLAISVAMNALIIPLFALGSFPIDKLVIGLLGMSGALLALALASKAMNGSLVGAVSITAMAIALNLLIIPISAFAAMGWGAMLTGVAGLALSLGALAGVSILLGPATIPLLAFSAAIGVMGLAMLAAGAGLALFSTGLLTLAGMTSAAVTTIIATLGALAVGLTSMIPTLVKFIANVVKQVAIAIRDNAPEIITIVAQTMVRVLTTLSTYIPEFAKAAVKMITSLIDSIATEGPKIINSVVNLIITMVETMAKTIDENGPRFINSFLGLIGSVLRIMVEAGTAVAKALFGWIPGIEGAMNKVATTAESAIAGALDTARIGEEKGSDFSKGLASKSKDAKESGEKISTSANEGLKSVDASKSGGNFVSRFISGILGRKKDVENASTQLASAAEEGTSKRLEIRSPSRIGMEQGEYYGEGVAIGIDNSTSTVEKSTKKMSGSIGSGFSSVMDTVRDKLFIKDKDVKENEENVAKVSESYSGMSKSKVDSQKKSSDSIKGSLSDEFTKAKELIDERKYYNQLSLKEELAAWQDLQAKYAEGTEERKQANREAYRVENEIVKDNFKVFKDKLDERDYYNQLSLEDELTNWKYAQNVYIEGSEERKQVDREVFRVEKEIEEQKKKLQKESFEYSKDWIAKSKEYHELSLKDELAAWERVQKRYLEGSDERKQADSEVLRVKNEINQKLLGINDEYLKNVQETNRALIDGEKKLNDEYERTYKDRVKSLTNFVGLFDKVKTQDSQNPITGTGLVENLRGQVNTIATWTDDMQRLAQKGIDEGLLKELEDMGPSAAIEIAALNDLTSSQLDQYVELWRKKNQLARTQATKELTPLREETNQAIDDLKRDTEKKLDEYKDEWIKKIGEIRVGTKEGFVGLTDDMETVGENVIDGLMKGMSDKESPLYAKASEMASSIQTAIKEALDINSPSRVMMVLGEFAGQGLANGIGNSARFVVKRTKELSTKAVDSVNKFISTFQQPVFDNEIHLKAVVDDSEISQLNKNLNGTDVPYYLGTTNALVSSAKSSFRQNGDKTTSSDRSKSQSSANSSNSDSNRPIIIQSVLNGRIIAEETVDDISQLMGNRTNLGYAMRGV